VATSLAPIVAQFLDDYALVLAGGTVETYEAGTTTPLATYQDYDGLVPNENPIVLNAAGRAEGGIRVTNGVAYKFVIKDSDENIIDTIDDIIVGEAEGESDNQYVISLSYVGTPGASATMGVHSVTHANTIPIDFDGASGDVITAPASDYVISVKKDGVEVGTITISSAGVFTFDTTGGATVSLAYGSRLSFHAPASVGTAADFGITIVGDLA
jgi:hypothetical protein